MEKELPFKKSLSPKKQVAAKTPEQQAIPKPAAKNYDRSDYKTQAQTIQSTAQQEYQSLQTL